jgi:hypothetical protein
VPSYGPNVSGDYTIHVSGPLFDGSIHAQMRKAIRAIEEEIGDMAVEVVRDKLDGSLRNPTGYYRSRVTKERQGDEMTITDGKVVYGPWLEGVGSRNQTTNFKGYHSFERASKEVDGKVPDVVDRMLERYLI